MNDKKENILEIKNLSVSLEKEKNKIPVLNNISLEVKEGQVLGIVGESGCGKSMLASVLMGLIPSHGKINTGTIYFDGTYIEGFSQKQFQQIRGSRISMIFQEPMTSLNPLMPCGIQIEECILAHNKIKRSEAKRITLEMIEQVGIKDPEVIYRQVPGKLSGGMRQRIMIAAALVCKPKLLICDEPTTAIDVTIQAQILQLIKKLQRENGTTVLFISHDMAVISEMSDNIAVFYAGSLVEYGKKKDIFLNPLHPYTSALQKAIPNIDKQVDYLETIPGIVPSPEKLPAGCIFADRCKYAEEKCFMCKPELVNVGTQKVKCFKPLNK